MSKKSGKLSVEEIIHQAVTAQRAVSERQSQDVFRATERRLYAYPVIRLKVINDCERIEEIQQHGVTGKSASVIKYQRSGMRLLPEEIADVLVKDIMADIAASEGELKTIEKALGIIANDPYADIVKLKYFEGKNDDEIALLMSCDSRTVRRNKSRLVARLSVYLYGVAAVA